MPHTHLYVLDPYGTEELHRTSQGERSCAVQTSHCPVLVATRVAVLAAAVVVLVEASVVIDRAVHSAPGEHHLAVVNDY